MPRKHVDRVNVIKSVKVAGKWRSAAVVERDGEIIRDHVWVDGQDEHHPEGRYHLDWHEGGKRRRQTIATFDEPAEVARRKCRELNASNLDVGSGVPNRSRQAGQPGVTLRAAIGRYLDFIEVHRSHGTFLSYRLTLGLLHRCYRKTYVHEVRRDDILQFLVQCHKQRLSSRTIYDKLVVALQFFKWYGQIRLVERTDWPVYVETIRPIYALEEIDLLIRYAKEEERVFLKFLLASGFRDREVRYLLWRDIDFLNCIVRVTRKAAWRFNPKNREERVVPLPSPLILQLKDLKEGRNAQPINLVFPNSKGNPNSSHILTVQRVAERAGLNCGQCITKHGNKCAEGPHCRHFYLHKFRHTFATEHLRHGIDICTLQRWMGHKDVQSTMVYLKGLESEDALARVNSGSIAMCVQ